MLYNSLYLINRIIYILLEWLEQPRATGIERQMRELNPTPQYGYNKNKSEHNQMKTP